MEASMAKAPVAPPTHRDNFYNVYSRFQFEKVVCFFRSAAGTIFVDLEQGGTFVVTGPCAASVAAGLMLQFSAAPWSSLCNVAVWAPGVRIEPSSRYRIVKDLDTYKTELIKHLDVVVQTTGGDPTHVARARPFLSGDEAAQIAPHVLVVLGDAPSALLSALGQLAQPGKGFVICGMLPANMGTWGLQTAENGSAVLLPHSISLSNVALRAGLAVEALQAVSRIEQAKSISSAPLRERAQPDLQTTSVSSDEAQSDQAVHTLAIDEEIRKILKTAPVELQLLRPQPNVRFNGTECGVPEQVEVVTHLALHEGNSSYADLESDLWPGLNAKPLRSATIKGLSVWLTGPGKTSLLQTPHAQNTCQLMAYASDWSRFVKLRSLSAQTTSDSDELRCLDAALSLVGGEACRDGGMGWFVSGGFAHEISSAIADAATEAARLARSAGDPDSALRYARIGISANPWDVHVRSEELSALTILSNS
jgi:hypothetical protein